MIGIILKNWRIAASLLSAFAIAFAFTIIYKKVAFSHPKVKELLSKSIKLDSLVIVQEIQLEACSVKIIGDSLRYYKDIIQHQINGKKLLNRATYAESLLNQYKGQGVCRYQEDSIVGNWLNRQKFTVWRTKPCLN